MKNKKMDNNELNADLIEALNVISKSLKIIAKRSINIEPINKGNISINNKKTFYTVGQYFKKERIKIRMSQKEISKKLGYTSPQFISNFERGVSFLPIKKLAKLTNILNLSSKKVINMVIKSQKSYLEEFFY